MRTALITCAAAVAALVAAGDGSAAPNSPVPVPGAHNCGGQFVAVADHWSGTDGASGNAKASAGPGYFLGSSTSSAIADYRAEYCGN